MLFLLRFLNTANDNFNYTKSILIEAQLVYLRLHLCKYKIEDPLECLISLLGLQNQLLDHMGTLLIDRKLKDLALKCLLHKLFVQRQLNIVEDTLNSMRPALIAANLGEICLNELQDL